MGGNRILGIAFTIVSVAACAKAQSARPDGAGGGDDASPTADASCGTTCDQDHDGVVDGSDLCPNTPTGAMVNNVGCADSQLTPMLEPMFPPFGLTWVPTGDLGMAGGLTWTYTGIQRKDLFHIYWIVCDDPATPCGLSLDGPIDPLSENWQFSVVDSDFPNGKLVFTNTTHILLADTTTPALTGRLTITVVDASNAPVRIATATMLGVTGRIGEYGAELTGTGFKVVALAEVQDTTTSTWTPYIDYYNAAPTPMTGGETRVSFGGSFYSK